MLGVYESDERRGKLDFAAEYDAAPADLKEIFNLVEFLPFRRRAFEAQTMYRELLRRGGQAVKRMDRGDSHSAVTTTRIAADDEVPSVTVKSLRQWGQI